MSKSPNGLRIKRRYTTAGVNPLDQVEYTKRRSVITNTDGSVVFEMNDVEVPASWSQLATDIIVSKYFRKRGVPGAGHETSARQVVHRLAHTIRHAGESLGGYFATSADADAFEAELAYHLIHQYGAFNSPVWFNVGLHHEYGITGSGGNWAWNPLSDAIEETADAYSHPQGSACFIQSVTDDLMSIFDLAKNEARLFKYGSGCTSGNSRIYIEGDGFLPIGEVFRRFQADGCTIQDFDGKGRYIDVTHFNLSTLSVDPKTGTYTRDRIDRVWSYDVAPEDKISVRLDNGTKTVVSAWHPFLVWDGERLVERRADQLTRGDAVFGPNETALKSIPYRPANVRWTTSYHNHDEQHCIAINPDLAWLCGYFLGDGSLGWHNHQTTNQQGRTYEYEGLRLRFHDETRETLERVIAIVEKEFGETATIQQDGRGSKGCTVAFAGRKTTGFFAALFEPGPKTYDLKMPSFVWESGRDVASSLLAGLVDSDGWVRDGRAHYATACAAFAQDVGVLASLLGLGGGVTHDRTMSKVTVVHRHVGDPAREFFAALLTNPKRRQRLIEYRPPAHERKFCMPLCKAYALELFGDRPPAEWLNTRVGQEIVHLGRLHYEGVINPIKLQRCLESLVASGHTSALTKTLGLVARSVAFVAEVEPCLDNPDFFDLTVAQHNNYLAGEGGLVVIHNTGTNFSKLRGHQERLSGGGTSSGLMSFLEVLDRGAGATKSGGTTRRAAKMVCLDMDHPEISDFINWKMREEKKVRALIDAGYPSDFNGEAYRTVSGQNSNNSVRIPDPFMKTYLEDGPWQTTFRTTGEICETFKARALMHQIADAAWSCADPGVQYDSIINKWHTCKNTDRINGSNPCVTGDTLVATTEGLRPIAELVGASCDLVTFDGQIVPVTEIFATGFKEVFELRTHCGYTLKLTADHKVWTANRGDVAAQDLQPSDELVLTKGLFGRGHLDQSMAEFIGLALGDGCKSNDAQGHIVVTMGSGETEILAEYVDYLNTVKADRKIAGVRHTPTGIRTSTSAEAVVSIVDHYAVLNEGSAQKRLLANAFTLDEASAASLLRGLFTTDGTVANYGEKSQYIALDSTSLLLLRQVQKLLLSFGIKSKLYENRRGGITESLLPDGHGGLKTYNVQEMHSLRISCASRVLFEERIGFHPKSAKAAALRAMNEAVGTYRDTFSDTFESLTPLGTQKVYDLTEPVTHHFAADGLMIHNCSEYMFLDNTACNLASLNLVKYYNTETTTFDIEAYRHAIRIFFIAQEILVDLASYPTKTIALNSHDYRPLGLGYANLGTLLMIQGVPYDSDKGRAICAALTGVLTGHAYTVSAEMAAVKLPFVGFAKNREPMLDVIDMHRNAAYQIDATACPPDLLTAAREDWDRALETGKQHGYRNAQSSVLAPTGTIGLLLDCDTTGIEPDFALVKFKKLAGGGYFKIINQSIPMALKRLGYTDAQIDDIIHYVKGTSTLAGAPEVNSDSLLARGVSTEAIAKIEAALPGAFDLRHVFHRGTLGEAWDSLTELGYTETQIEAANVHICGTMTIEGAPHLKPAHLPIFDCANTCGALGQRFLAPMSHVKMMAAAQPFISGAISKTINVPHESTVDEIEQLYVESWRLGLKAVALYRDGSKNSQPLTSSSKGEKKAVRETAADVVSLPLVAAASATTDRHAEVAEGKSPPAQRRHRMPKKRLGFTQEARVAGQKIYLRTGEYEDGSLGEIFIDLHKEGATFRSLTNCFAIAVSLGLQHGVPIKEYVDAFTFTRFDPSGVCDHPNIKMCTSVIDYVFRVLGMEYLGQTDFLQVKPNDAAQAMLPAPQVHGNAREVARRLDKLTGSLQANATSIRKSNGNGHGPRAPLHGIENAPSPLPQGEGKGEGVPTVMVIPAAPLTASTGGGLHLAATPTATAVISEHFAGMMGDAPFCDSCGNVTVRNGSCYRCLNCGNSMGCS